MSLTAMPASLMTDWNGARVRSSRSWVIFWNSARVSCSSRNSGFLSASTVMYGRLIDVLCELDPGQDYDWLLARSEVMPVGEVPVCVVDLPTLIELKTKAGRPKDRITVPILVATLEEREREKP